MSTYEKKSGYFIFFQMFQDVMQAWNRILAYEVFRIEGQKEAMQKPAPQDKFSNILFLRVCV
jgi:hypothetical protein